MGCLEKGLRRTESQEKEEEEVSLLQTHRLIETIL